MNHVVGYCSWIEIILDPVVGGSRRLISYRAVERRGMKIRMDAENPVVVFSCCWMLLLDSGGSRRFAYCCIRMLLGQMFPPNPPVMRTNHGPCLPQKRVHEEPTVPVSDAAASPVGKACIRRRPNMLTQNVLARSPHQKCLSQFNWCLEIC